ncbi:MAG: peptidoglycan DD-metalloendopeptidase family protein [Schleiferiaceae bacterium]|nr:peptidoglycan DD-metalloendopeptidase family protein [Flavobacteriaceae bacterium]MDP4616479.1 peptidoglycan DD-metalloendopeptidase family protein [Schleiferiaceae bacterium]MDP4758414.1 peptidoglycan DD-metalloendopeptidase family protein [Schleiferiaceae bacterium]MDP4877409.1 peptidoglycan DD-metalloendopeptidase family protein [Schleiferiaceae bacterium]
MKKLLFVFLLVLTTGLQAQTKEELQRQKVLLQDQIDLASELLLKTKSTKEASLSELQTLNQKIEARNKLIRTMDRQIRSIDREVANKAKEIETLEARVDSLKSDYADLIKLAQRQQKPRDQILFILSSKSFAQAAKRMQYFKDMAAYREQQVQQIAIAQETLAREREALIAKKAEKIQVQTAQEGEKIALQADAQIQEVTVQNLQSKESTLKKDIDKKQREAQQLEQQIKRIIAEEMRKAKERAERSSLENEAKELGLISGKDFSARTSNKALKQLIDKAREAKGMDVRDDGPSFAMTPEARALANNFASNKGALPWPVERGIITGKFGKHPHPIVKGVIVDNPHIEITTEESAIVRSVFEGEVSSVVPIPGANVMVLVRHGNYFTVYSNLINVKVKAGDVVSLKEPIGTAFTDEEGKTMVQLGIWKDADIQDPNPWLAK